MKHFLILFIFSAFSSLAQVKDPTVPGEELKKALLKTTKAKAAAKTRTAKQAVVEEDKIEEEIKRLLSSLEYCGCIVNEDKSQISLKINNKYIFCQSGEHLIIENRKLTLVTILAKKAVFEEENSGRKFEFYYRKDNEE